MKPPKRATEFEKVSCDEFIGGEIETIQYEEAHEFKFQGNIKTASAVRFKFKLDGYKYPHYSRWMTFSYGEKANLYLKYLLPLVENAKPDMDFDIDALQGMKVKTLWAENNDFQNLETIRPLGGKLKFDAKAPETMVINADELMPDEDVPF